MVECRTITEPVFEMRRKEQKQARNINKLLPAIPNAEPYIAVFEINLHKNSI